MLFDLATLLGLPKTLEEISQPQLLNNIFDRINEAAI
jgi:hypothetical protein